LSEDPVQVGAIWNGGGGADCRNLLDFDDMDLDSHGRVVVGFADGCTAACAAAYANWTAGHGPAPTGKQSRDSWGTILRQTTGLGLFAKDDQPGHGPGTAPTAGATSSSGKGTPAPPLGLLVVTVGALALARRRRA
jgi:muramoyltetrapeptide carboxypeptidase LdcA involved in peptidoglycan recycling